MYSTVYELVFPDGSRYVGMTSRFNARINQHKSNPVNSLVAEKMEKYSENGFHVNIIEKDIHDSVAYFIERFEIATTDDDKCLNVHCKNPNEYMIEFHSKAKEMFNDNYNANRKTVVKNLTSLIDTLPKLNPMYKNGYVTNKDKVLEECQRLMDYLGLTVELKEVEK